MDVIWVELQQLAVLVLFWPLTTLAAFAAGASVLLALAELVMYATYRVLTRIGFLA